MKNNYKRKYQKYKSKYLNLKKSLSIKESGVYANRYGVERDLTFFEDDYIPVDTDYPYNPFTEYNDDTNFSIQEREIKRQTTFAEENEPVGIGKKGLARGDIIEDVEDDEFIKLSLDPQKEKILLIDTIDAFDNFTEKYGKLESNDVDNDKEVLFISWDKVANDYKGFYLNPGLNSDRYSVAFYKGKTYPSWWEYEYDIDGAIIFV